MVAHGPAMGGAVQAASAPQPPARRRLSEWLLIVSLPLLFAVAWAIGRVIPHTPGSDVEYYLGLTGGIMMLLLFLYPLRKHLRFMHGWGKTKYWFALHMTLGIGGPLVILVHSKFHIGSVNAGVALACMLVVMLSGVAGRFIYIRIHHGLYGRRATLKELQILVGLNSVEVRSKLAFAPDVEQALIAFEAQALERHQGLSENAWAFLTLGFRGRAVYRHCKRSLKTALGRHAHSRGWDKAKLERRLRAAKRLAHAYVSNAQRVGQFSVYERLFSLWHVLHVPLVYLMVLSAVAHVVAVHMY